MSGQGASCESEKASSVRALKFPIANESDASLITSSVRKPKRGSKVPNSPQKSQAVQHVAEESSCEFPDVPSPELKRRKTQPEEQPQLAEERMAGAAADQAEKEQTASPPRPPPELPPGIPAPPIPQGRVPMLDRRQTPPSEKKTKGVLHTIFSPIFQILQPGEGSGEGVEKSESPSADQQSGKRTSLRRPIARKSKSRTPEQAASGRLISSSEAQQDELRVRAEAERIGKAPHAAGPSRPTASEGASTTDGESETCLGNQSASAQPTRDILEEDSEGESDVGEEVYTTDEGNDMDEDSLEFDPYAFIKSLPPLEQCAPAWRRCLLPKQTRQCKRKTLVLDLDETLVHSTLDGSVSTSFSFEVFFNNRTHSVSVRQRPHLSAFLQRCADLFEVVIFTASQKLYAEQLLNILDPQRKFIRHRIFRDDCLLVEGNYLKDLTVLGRDLAHTIIVDNSPQAFGFQLENGVPIESWYDDQSDTELMRLLPFLESLVDVPDVRPVIVNAFKLQKLVDRAPHY